MITRFFFLSPSYCAWQEGQWDEGGGAAERLGGTDMLAGPAGKCFKGLGLRVYVAGFRVWVTGLGFRMEARSWCASLWAGFSFSETRTVTVLSSC